MDEFIEVNINDEVKVKLTEYGRKILAEDNNQYAEWYPKAFKKMTPDDFKKQEDENGYTRYQLWSLMEKFGEHIGMTKKNCFETNILIKHKSKP